MISQRPWGLFNFLENLFWTRVFLDDKAVKFQCQSFDGPLLRRALLQSKRNIVPLLLEKHGIPIKKQPETVSHPTSEMLFYSALKAAPFPF